MKIMLATVTFVVGLGAGMFLQFYILEKPEGIYASWNGRMIPVITNESRLVLDVIRELNFYGKKIQSGRTLWIHNQWVQFEPGTIIPDGIYYDGRPEKPDGFIYSVRICNGIHVEEEGHWMLYGDQPPADTDRNNLAKKAALTLVYGAYR